MFLTAIWKRLLRHVCSVTATLSSVSLCKNKTMLLLQQIFMHSNRNQRARCNTNWVYFILLQSLHLFSLSNTIFFILRYPSMSIFATTSKPLSSIDFSLNFYSRCILKGLLQWHVNRAPLKWQLSHVFTVFSAQDLFIISAGWFVTHVHFTSMLWCW